MVKLKSLSNEQANNKLTNQKGIAKDETNQSNEHQLLEKPNGTNKNRNTEHDASIENLIK